jgi:hypothetical protein
LNLRIAMRWLIEQFFRGIHEDDLERAVLWVEGRDDELVAEMERAEAEQHQRRLSLAETLGAEVKQ